MKRIIASISIILFALALPAASAQAKELPRLDDGQVIMNWSDFEKILKELLKPPPEVVEEEEEPPPEPPVEYSFRSASLEVAIGEGFADIEATYGLDVLKDKKWVMAPIGSSSSGVHNVKVDGKQALINESGGNIYVLLLGKASHVISVSYTVAAPQNPGPNSFQAYVANLPGATIDLSAPSKLSEIKINGAVTTEAVKRDNVQDMRAVIGATNQISVAYNVPVPEALAVEAAKLPAKIYSSVEMLVSIADEVTTANAWFNYDIKHSPVSKFRLKTPKGYDVVNVAGQGVSGWKNEDGELDVSINYEAQGSYRLNVQFEAKRAEASGKVSIAEPETAGAERESGFIAVETRSSLEVAIESMEGIAPVDAIEVPPSLRHRAKYPILYAFRFGKHPYSAALTVTRHSEVEVLTAAIDTINLVTLFTDDGKTVTRMIYEVRNNKKQYLKIDLPKKAKVWSAFLDNEPVKPSQNARGQVLVPLKKSGADGRKVSFTVELIYYAPIDKMTRRGKLNITFPKADIPASEMLVSLYLPPRYKYKNFEGDLEETLPEYPYAGIGDQRDVGEAGAAAPPGKTAAGPRKQAGAKRKKGLYSQRAMMRQEEMEHEIADELQEMDQEKLQGLGYIGNRPQAPSPLQKPSKTPAASQRRLGILPVKFNVPLRGNVVRLNKLLVMDEAPQLTFSYRKRWKPIPWNKVKLGAKIALALLFLGAIFYIIRRIRKRFIRTPTQS